MVFDEEMAMKWCGHRAYGIEEIGGDSGCDVAEVERQAWLRLWGPIVKLPIVQRQGRERMVEHPMLGWKVERSGLVRSLEQAVMMRSMVMRSLSAEAKRVMEYLATGVLKAEQVVDADVCVAAQLSSRIRTLREALR